MLEKKLTAGLLVVSVALPSSTWAEPGRIFDEIDNPVKEPVGAPNKEAQLPPGPQPDKVAGGSAEKPAAKPAWRVGYRPSPASPPQPDGAVQAEKQPIPVLVPEETPAKKDGQALHASAELEREWSLCWRDCAKYYIGWKGEFYSFPKYEKAYPSSVLIDQRRMSEKSYSVIPSLAGLRQSYRDETGQERKRVLQKDAAEVFAAVSLMPQVADGEYGWIHSGQVVRIAGQDEVVLNQIWLVDAEDLASQERKITSRLLAQDVADFRTKVEEVWRRPRNGGRPEHRNDWETINQYTAMQREAAQWWFAERERAKARQAQSWGENAFGGYEWHVLGFKTEKMKEGMRWPSGDKGVQLAILVVADHSVYAAPVAFLEKGLSEAEMLEMLGKRGLTKADFAALAKEARKRDPKNWLLPLINAIDKGDKVLGLPKQTPVVPIPKKPEAKPGAPVENDVELAK